MSGRSAGVDGERIRRRAGALAYPRYPGSAGDRRVTGELAEALRRAGWEVAVEPFSYDLRPAWRALRGLLGGAALLVAGAGALAASAPLGAAVLLAAALAGGGLFLAWAPWLERLYRRPGPTTTANIEGRRRSRGRRRTLVLVAHHDSKSQSLTLPWRLLFTLASLLGAALLAALLGASAVAGGPVDPPWLPPATGGVTAASLLALATLRSANRSPGGVDNAGSLGILLELADLLPALLPADVEVVLLSPGAEEDHMVGAMRWLDRHRAELEGEVWAINLDGAGIPGRVSLLERFGFGRAFSPELSATARAAARRLELPVRGVLLPPGMGVDAIPFAHRGIPCLTLASGSLCRAALAVHSPADRAENLDADALERVARLALEMTLELARSG